MPIIERVPEELKELAEKIRIQAEKKGYNITRVEAYRIIAKSYKTK